MEICNLSPGDHFMIDYGIKQRLFYVLENLTDQKEIIATRRKWCVSATIQFPYKELTWLNFSYSGRGKERWWRCLLPGLKDVIPMYSNKLV